MHRDTTKEREHTALSARQLNRILPLTMPLPLLLDSKQGHDILIGQIFPFLGVGHYRVAGAVNKSMQNLYLDFCRIEFLRKQQENTSQENKKVDITDEKIKFTLPSVIVSSRSCVDMYMNDILECSRTWKAHELLFPSIFRQRRTLSHPSHPHLRSNLTRHLQLSCSSSSVP